MFTEPASLVILMHSLEKTLVLRYKLLGVEGPSMSLPLPNPALSQETPKPTHNLNKAVGFTCKESFK